MNLYDQILKHETITLTDTEGIPFNCQGSFFSQHGLLLGLKFTRNDKTIQEPLMSSTEIKNYLAQYEPIN